MKYEICSRYIYKEMRVTPDQGHDEASFSTKKHTLNNKDESNEATIGIPLPHHKQQCGSSPTLEGLLPDVRGNHSFLSQTRYWLGLNLTRGRLQQRDWLLGSSQYYRYLQHRYLHYTESGVRQHGSLYCWLAHTAGSLYCVCCCIT